LYPPILLSSSLRAIGHAPTPNPRRFRPLWCAPTHTGTSAALSHENDDYDDEVPSNAERRTSNVERRDTCVTSNNARAHDADDVTTVTVTMKATMTATVVVLRVVVHVV